jgi:hypothetical protein
MSESSNKSINVGDITGTGIAVGHGAQAHVTITQQNRDEISSLLKQLRDEITKADIPEGSKNVLLNKAVPGMDEAVTTKDPKSGLEKNIERINDQLEGVGAIAQNASGIVDVVSKIAKTAGIAIKTVAPFLAGLL